MFFMKISAQIYVPLSVNLSNFCDSLNFLIEHHLQVKMVMFSNTCKTNLIPISLSYSPFVNSEL